MMHTTLILTVLGPDHPGLVKSLSELLNQQQGNWTESRMVHLGGQFAGLLQVALPRERVANLKAALDVLQDNGLKVLIAETNAVPATNEILKVEVLGLDRPGIIRDITTQLASLKVNIEELFSEQRPAPMSGGTLFFAALSLSLPAGVSAEQVQTKLEELSDQLMVDLNFA
ncbi:ACT domain-containing protein [uncultured Thiothrix sp.]|uniref:glycine cleavage system protein R n=1 Tax=uncultured Thiothrix sp. TaxID=223185 RepID=UPI00261B5709|nr:ACT domain-containing protein [uncultured Thiothrix sp.]